MNKNKEETTTLYIWDIPEDLKKDFKAKCAQKGQTMKNVIIEMMDDYVNDKNDPFHV